MEESVVKSDLKESTQKLLKTFYNFPEEHFNTAPPGGGMVCRSDSRTSYQKGVGSLFNGELKSVNEIRKKNSSFSVTSNKQKYLSDKIILFVSNEL